MLRAIHACSSVTFSIQIRPVLSQDDSEDVVIEEQHFSIKCPITQLTMIRPVRNRHCRHNYDQIGVEQLIKNRGDKAR